MGGLIIKVGQFLSARADVLPESFTRELGSLQDIVPPRPWAEVEPSFAKLYGKPPGEVFTNFNPEPVAAASFAQVYLAQFGGRRVAIKVLRPGIEEIVATDLQALRIAASWATRLTEWGRRFDIMAVWQDLATTTLQELDTPGEARRLVRFARNFKDDPKVRVPGLVRELTGGRIIVMDEVRGAKPDDLEALGRMGVNRDRLAQDLTRSYMKQWLVDGFFHADPHPGNIFVHEDGSFTYVDFGMMGEVEASDREALQALVAGVLVQDMDQVVSALERLSFLRPTSDRARLRSAISLLVRNLMDMPPPSQAGWEPTEDAEKLAGEIRHFLHENTLQLPIRYLFLGRAMGILAGLVAKLAPTRPFVRLLANGAAQYVNTEGGRSSTRSALDLILRRLVRLPGRMLDAVDRLAEGDVGPKFDLSPLTRTTRAQIQTQRALTRSILALAAGLAAAIPPMSPLLHGILWLVAIGLGVSAFVATL